MAAFFVQSEHGFEDGLFQVFDGLEEVVVNGRSFEVSPKPFDEIQVRGVAGVPDHVQPLAVLSEVSLDRLRVMDRTVVEEQPDLLSVAVQVVHQPRQEFQKLGATLLRRDEDRGLARQRVQRAEDRHSAILAGGGDNDPLARQRPAARQAGIQMEFGLVEIEKREVAAAGNRFFKPRLRCRLARATSAGS